MRCLSYEPSILCKSTGLVILTSSRKVRETKHQPGRASCSQQHSCRSISLHFLQTFRPRLCTLLETAAGWTHSTLILARMGYRHRVHGSDQPKQDLAASAGSEASAEAWPGASAEYRSFGYSPMLLQFTDASVFYRSFGFQPKQITSNIGCPKFHSNFDIPLLLGMAWDIRLIFGVLKVWMKSFFTCI